MENADATFRDLANWMESLGLGELFTYRNGQPSGWLWEQIQNGVTTQEELYIGLSETEPFKQRFPVIAEQQAEAAAGRRPGRVLTPEDVLNYEQDVSDIMRAAGLPSTFYDDPSDFTSLMRAGIPATDVGLRIETAYDKIVNAPADVRNMFEEYFGVGQSDAALAAYVLDPEMVMSRLERARQSAVAGATARRYDIRLNQQQAEDLVLLAGSQEAAVSGLETIGGQASLYAESIGEATDLSAEREGMAAQFGSDVGVSQTEAQTALERRLRERQARLQGSSGGAMVTQSGVVGLG